jgi:hypothetical protein
MALNGSPFQDETFSTFFTIGPLNVHGEPHISTASGTACVWPHADASSLSMMTVTTVMMTAAGRKRLTERDPTSHWRASQNEKRKSASCSGRAIRSKWQVGAGGNQSPPQLPPAHARSSRISINRFDGQLTIFVDFNDEPFRVKSKIREKEQAKRQEKDEKTSSRFYRYGAGGYFLLWHLRVTRGVRGERPVLRKSRPIDRPINQNYGSHIRR